MSVVSQGLERCGDVVASSPDDAQIPEAANSSQEEREKETQADEEKARTEGEGEGEGKREEQTQTATKSDHEIETEIIPPGDRGREERKGKRAER